MKLSLYYQLAKPGIIYANVLTALAGYLFGSKWQVQAGTFIALLVGTSLVIGGAAVCNNIMDRNIDTVMKRTKKRALVTGEISLPTARLYAAALTLIGFGILTHWTNWIVVLIGLIGFVDYVWAYGWAKRHNPYSTLIGSISGSTSIVAGYSAATGRFDTGAWLLFAILTFWQMPHFYAIAMYRRADYKAAHLPVMPVIRSTSTAKLRVMIYTVAFIVASVLLTTTGYAGMSSGIILFVLGAAWLVKGLQTYTENDGVAWGKRMFLFSLVVNIGISIAVTIGSVAP